MNFSIKHIYPVGMVLILQLLPLFYPQLQSSNKNLATTSSDQIAPVNKEDGLIKILFKPMNIVTIKF